MNWIRSNSRPLLIISASLIASALVLGGFASYRSYQANHAAQAELSLAEVFSKRLVHEHGDILYARAWPSATFEGATWLGIRAVNGRFETRLKLDGRDWLLKGPLWTEATLVTQADSVIDLRFGLNNAVLVQPGKTKERVESLLSIADVLNRRIRGDADQPSTVHTFRLENACSHPARALIAYRDFSGELTGRRWTSLRPHERQDVTDSLGTPLRINREVAFYYAETTDKSGIDWTGDTLVVTEDRELAMRRITASRGVFTATFTC